MISEPELVGGAEFDRSEVLAEAPPPRPPRARRPWLWALGGAALASAVWGAGLYAYERREDPGPDLGGYGAVEDFCAAAELKALSGVLGKRGEAAPMPEQDDPVLFETGCAPTFGAPESGYDVNVTYTLHKVTDPGPEFAVRAKQYGFGEPVEDLGEQAFFADGDGEGGRLVVLDGQAEFTFDISTSTVWNEETGEVVREGKRMDLSGIEVPMTQDMLALMAALKK